MAEFRTTFIPKTPVGAAPASDFSGMGSHNIPGPHVRRSTWGIATLVLVLLFIATLIMSVGVYGLDKTTTAQIEQLSESLTRSQKQFEPKVIVELKELDTRLKTASTLLASHNSLSYFFELLGQQTLPGLAFDSFRYSNDPKQGNFIIMTGRATSYETIAEQSAIFGDDVRVDQHVFSNFKLLDSGYISFDLLVIPSARGILYSENNTEQVPVPEVVTQVVETSSNPLLNPVPAATQTVDQNGVVVQTVQ